VPVKDAVGDAVKRRVESHRVTEESVKVCSCQTSCRLAEIPNS
jgi:hypothetical protein